jgi:Helix-turn-helix domain
MLSEFVATVLERHQWMEAVLASTDLGPATVKVAICLALHFNLKTGQCNPSIPTIARKTALSTRAVEKAISALATNWIDRKSISGRGNSYRLQMANVRLPQDGQPPNRCSGVHDTGPPTARPRPTAGWYWSRDLASLTAPI